ncbi:hypothetical protein SEVIR_6G233800v4 [Setaria viridis]|uniref:Uncharacterized protein n=1 Tax=Setaria viridis TaxID=4556 RepID=A0A4U6U6V0_SETVI|nr:uncharacterized protein LOC117860346 isoform X2 [Setaria viridis]TKW11440.1 hypothetical protein SEVIR_6G233800v2 [Setaria viridis]
MCRRSCKASTKTGNKVWRGPLPRPRISPSLSLGDVLVRDVRSKGRKGARMLLAELELEDGASSEDGETAATEPMAAVAAAVATADSNFEFRETLPFQLHGPTGPTGGAVCCIAVGPQGRFRCAEGLSFLFTAGGKPRSLASSHPHTTVTPKVSHSSSPRSESVRWPAKAKMFRGADARGAREAKAAGDERGGGGGQTESIHHAGRDLNRGFHGNRQSEGFRGFNRRYSFSSR